MNKNIIQKIGFFIKDKIIKKPLVLSLLILLLLGLFIIFGSFFYMDNYLNGRSENTESIDFVIAKGEGVREICQELEERGLISDDWPLLIYLKLTGESDNIKAGEYRLSKSLSPKEIVDTLTQGKVASRKITIPEGWTNEKIGNYLEKEKIVTKTEFIEATKKSYDYWFLEDLPQGRSLEGFLFPDTYQISINATADDIVEKMLANFDKKTRDLKLEIENSAMSTFDIVTLASVVEKEVSKPEERRVVAGVFLKRLDVDMALESCATIGYYLKTDNKVLSYEQLKTVSPYNTYLNKGLPYGPIGNPGLDSIQAVLRPTKTDYWFFLSADGITYYAKTLDEQEANKAKYLK